MRSRQSVMRSKTDYCQNPHGITTCQACSNFILECVLHINRSVALFAGKRHGIDSLRSQPKFPVVVFGACQNANMSSIKNHENLWSRRYILLPRLFSSLSQTSRLLPSSLSLALARFIDLIINNFFRCSSSPRNPV